VRPPVEITPRILQLVATVSEQLGAINSAHLNKPRAELRKRNRIRTIQSSLEIEGNTLTEKQITALLNNERVIAPPKDILEVQNAISIYDQLAELDCYSEKSFCFAHEILMHGLVEHPGKFRTKNVGIVKGADLAHLAPPSHLLKSLVSDLFKYLKVGEDVTLIKSCVFHYELEFIHPFLDGNGRMGRLWQTMVLIDSYPVFEYLPIEFIIKERQAEYYKALGESDKAGKSTIFIEFMLGIIQQALENRLKLKNVSLTGTDRIVLFLDEMKDESFSRQDYLRHFREISEATASRDLKEAVDRGKLQKSGDKRTTRYRKS
jgi:Fic family protein